MVAGTGPLFLSFDTETERDRVPVLLPELEDYVPTATGNSPLARIPELVETVCPICGGPARRDADVMDNFLDSAWYSCATHQRTTTSGRGTRADAQVAAGGHVHWWR